MRVTPTPAIFQPACRQGMPALPRAKPSTFSRSAAIPMIDGLPEVLSELANARHDVIRIDIALEWRLLGRGKQNRLHILVAARAHAYGCDEAGHSAPLLQAGDQQMIFLLEQVF